MSLPIVVRPFLKGMAYGRRKIIVRWEPGEEDVAVYCFQKLASLDARFIALCYRAKQAGIQCRDLMGVGVHSLDDPAAPASERVN